MASKPDERGVNGEVSVSDVKLEEKRVPQPQAVNSGKKPLSNRSPTPSEKHASLPKKNNDIDVDALWKVACDIELNLRLNSTRDKTTPKEILEKALLQNTTSMNPAVKAVYDLKIAEIDAGIPLLFCCIVWGYKYIQSIIDNELHINSYDYSAYLFCIETLYVLARLLEDILPKLGNVHEQYTDTSESKEGDDYIRYKDQFASKYKELLDSLTEFYKLVIESLGEIHPILFNGKTKLVSGGTRPEPGPGKADSELLPLDQVYHTPLNTKVRFATTDAFNEILDRLNKILVVLENFQGNTAEKKVLEAQVATLQSQIKQQEVNANVYRVIRMFVEPPYKLSMLTLFTNGDDIAKQFEKEDNVKEFAEKYKNIFALLTYGIKGKETPLLGNVHNAKKDVAHLGENAQNHSSQQSPTALPGYAPPVPGVGEQNLELTNRIGGGHSVEISEEDIQNLKAAIYKCLDQSYIKAMYSYTFKKQGVLIDDFNTPDSMYTLIDQSKLGDKYFSYVGGGLHPKNAKNEPEEQEVPKEQEEPKDQEDKQPIQSLTANPPAPQVVAPPPPPQNDEKIEKALDKMSNLEYELRKLTQLVQTMGTNQLSSMASSSDAIGNAKPSDDASQQEMVQKVIQALHDKLDTDFKFEILQEAWQQVNSMRERIDGLWDNRYETQIKTFNETVNEEIQALHAPPGEAGQLYDVDKSAKMQSPKLEKQIMTLYRRILGFFRQVYKELYQKNFDFMLKDIRSKLKYVQRWKDTPDYKRIEDYLIMRQKQNALAAFDTQSNVNARMLGDKKSTQGRVGVELSELGTKKTNFENEVKRLEKARTDLLAKIKIQVESLDKTITVDDKTLDTLDLELEKFLQKQHDKVDNLETKVAGKNAKNARAETQELTAEKIKLDKFVAKISKIRQLQEEYTQVVKNKQHADEEFNNTQKAIDQATSQQKVLDGEIKELQKRVQNSRATRAQQDIMSGGGLIGDAIGGVLPTMKRGNQRASITHTFKDLDVELAALKSSALGILVKLQNEQDKLLSKVPVTKLYSDEIRNILEEERERTSAYMAQVQNKMSAIYNNQYSVMDLVFDNEFMALYILKLLTYGFFAGALFLSEKLFNEMYMKKVYGKGENPPDILIFVGLFLGISVAMVGFLVLVMVLLSYVFKNPSNNFIINSHLIKSYSLDYAITMVIIGLFGIIVGMTIQKKRYFRYKTEGLRGIRALKEIIMSLAAVIIIVPYFAFF